MTMVSAIGRLKATPKKLTSIIRCPKKLIGPDATSICCSMALTAPENGSNSTTQEKATAITGAT